MRSCFYAAHYYAFQALISLIGGLCNNRASAKAGYSHVLNSSIKTLYQTKSGEWFMRTAPRFILLALNQFVSATAASACATAASAFFSAIFFAIASLIFFSASSSFAAASFAAFSSLSATSSSAFTFFCFHASNFACAAASSKAPFFTPPLRCFIR